jgi:hypothetical protein
MALGGAALGAIKTEFYDKPAAKRQRKAEAEKARWSPWTGMQAQNVAEPDTLGAALQGGMGLGMLGANIQSAEGQQGLLDAQKGYFEGMTPQTQVGMNDPFTALPGATAAGPMPAPMPAAMPAAMPVARPAVMPKIIAPQTMPLNNAWQQMQVAPQPGAMIAQQPVYSGGARMLPRPGIYQ